MNRIVSTSIMITTIIKPKELRLYKANPSTPSRPYTKPLHPDSCLQTLLHPPGTCLHVSESKAIPKSQPSQDFREVRRGSMPKSSRRCVCVCLCVCVLIYFSLRSLPWGRVRCANPRRGGPFPPLSLSPTLPASPSNQRGIYIVIFAALYLDLKLTQACRCACSSV